MIRILIFVFLSTIAFADNFVGNFNSSNFNLQSGQNRVDALEYRCTGRQCTFNDGSNNTINYQTSGGGTSNLTMNGKMPQNAGSQIGGDSVPMYLRGTMTIGKGSNLTMTGFDSIIGGDGLSIDGGSFHFVSKGTTNELSTIGFSGDISLKNNATLKIDNVDIFGIDSFTADNKSISIDSTSKMELNVKRFDNIKTMQNAGTFSLSGDFYNLGQDAQDEPKIATLNNTGQMKITGNFYNGGIFPNTISCIKGCGGGDIVNEGNIEVSGDFYNKGWQRSISEGINTVSDHSSVELKGGTLKVNTLAQDNLSGFFLINFNKI